MDTVAPLNHKNTAKFIGISERKLDDFSNSGAIPTVSIGRRKMYLMSDIDAFLKSRREGTPGLSAADANEVIRAFMGYYTAKEKLTPGGGQEFLDQLTALGVDVEFNGINPYGLKMTSAAIAEETKARIVDEFAIWAGHIAAGKWRSAVGAESKLRKSSVEVAFVGAGQQ